MSSDRQINASGGLKLQCIVNSQYISTFLMLPVASGSAPQVAISSSCHVIVAPSSAVGRFLVAGPTAWNSLPDYLRDPSLSEDTFRRLLKTYLFALY